MLVSTLLSRMQIFDNELVITSGGQDEERSIAALNMAQDGFEAVIASRPKLLQTYADLTTTAGQEYTTWPTGLLRLDDIWGLDPTTGKPTYRLSLVDETGGHGPNPGYWWVSSSVQGQPFRYAAEGENRILWAPTPDGVYTFRYYGFIAADDMEVRGDTFAYNDIVATPLAALATKFLAIGVGDSTEELTAAAAEQFGPVLKAIKKTVRTKPPSRYYSQVHLT